jgi:hypothetical protein
VESSRPRGQMLALVGSLGLAEELERKTCKICSMWFSPCAPVSALIHTDDPGLPNFSKASLERAPGSDLGQMLPGDVLGCPADPILEVSDTVGWPSIRCLFH